MESTIFIYFQLLFLMKKFTISLWLLCLSFLALVVSFATSSSQLGTISNSITTAVAETWSVIDDTLVDIVEKQSDADLLKELKDWKDSLKLTAARSCEDFDTVLTKWIEKNKNFFNQQGGGYYGRPMPVMMEGDTAITNTMVKTDSASKSSEVVGSSAWSMAPSAAPDHSSTNVQKAWIDEPDIIKNDGNYIYYVNNTKKLLYILKWPYNGSNLDLWLVNVVKTLRLPKSYQASDLLIDGNKLVLVATRYLDRRIDYNQKFYDTNARTSVVVFDISDKTKPTIARLLDFPGQLQDSRLSNGKLYVVNNLYFNRGPIYWIMNEKKSIDGVLNISNLIPNGMEAVKKVSGKMDKHLVKPDCKNIHYVLPETIDNFNPSVGLVHTIDLLSDTNANTDMFYGNAWQIHVTDKSLYTVSSISLWSYGYNSCPPNAKCAMPMIWRAPDNFSLIHKYSLITGRPRYQDSAVVKWDLLTQYSMDEDVQGNFRIITRNWNPQLATHIWKLDSKLQHNSQLLNIEPGEDFKASRFIWDKLYLVTFQQIDPLFVVDMANKPTILGELKIPWFSSYLHPYSPLSNGKQLLIGLGTDTIELSGRVTTNGVKLDLYEIDYNLKNTDGTISIKQIQTKTLWGKNSYSEATENPRVFVWNDKTKQLYLPIITQDEIEKKTCSKDYYGVEYCYPQYSYNTTFAGMKTLKLDPSGITEISSRDYKDQIISYLKANNTYYGNEWNNFGLDQRQFMQLGNRAGFVGDVSYFMNNAFVDFNSSKEGKLIKF